MRPFKFRAWDKVKGVWPRDVFIGVDGWHFQLSIDDHNENMVIMQYIGLKDTNGVDIYEGDVLGGLLGGGVVVWVPDEARFGISLGGEIHEVYFNELAQNELEVVGNIWDDFGLLEVSP